MMLRGTLTKADVELGFGTRSRPLNRLCDSLTTTVWWPLCVWHLTLLSDIMVR